MKRLLGSNQHIDRWGQAAPLADADWFNLLSQAQNEAISERTANTPTTNAPADLISRRPLEWERVSSTTAGAA